MTNKEEADVVMLALIASFMEKNKPMFSGFPRLITEINTLGSFRVTLAELISKQSAVTTGITIDKAVSFVDLGSLIIKSAKKGLVWANDINNQAVAAVFNITATGFSNQSRAKTLAQARGIADVLVANKVALLAYNVTEEDINAIINCIEACEGHVIAPGVASNSKKAATAAIKNVLKNINGSLQIIDGLISSEYADSHPDIVREYFINRRVDVAGVRHTGINVTFTDSVMGKAIKMQL